MIRPQPGIFSLLGKSWNGNKNNATLGKLRTAYIRQATWGQQRIPLYRKSGAHPGWLVKWKWTKRKRKFNWWRKRRVLRRTHAGGQHKKALQIAAWMRWDCGESDWKAVQDHQKGEKNIENLRQYGRKMKKKTLYNGGFDLRLFASSFPCPFHEMLAFWSSLHNWKLENIKRSCIK